MRGWENGVCGESGGRGGGGAWGGYLFMKPYRLQSPSRYLVIRRLTVGYSTISERDVQVCGSNL